MKKFLIGLAVLFAAFCFAGCSDTTDDTPTDDGGEVIEDPVEDEEKILVAYFSCTGNTEKIAGYIADTLEADIYEIVPAEPYTEEDLDYYDETSRAALEQDENSKARPEIDGELENAEDYDVIYIGYPIWWGRLPKIIYTFLETYDFSGKYIVPFCSSAGTGITVSVEEIKVLEPEAHVLTGRRFTSTVKQSEVVNWVSTLNFSADDGKQENENYTSMIVTIGNAKFNAELYNTAAAAEFKKLLPLTLEMSAMEHEKYYYLDENLLTADEAVGEISAGDIMLWNGNCIVIFYEDFETEYSYTKIGKIKNVSGLDEALGTGSVTVTFSLE